MPTGMCLSTVHLVGGFSIAGKNRPIRLPGAWKQVGSKVTVRGMRIQPE